MHTRNKMRVLQRQRELLNRNTEIEKHLENKLEKKRETQIEVTRERRVEKKGKK